MAHSFLEHAADGDQHLVNRGVRQATSPPLVGAARTRIDVGLHEGLPAGGRLLDRLAITQRAIDEAVGDFHADLRQVQVTEVVHGGGQPPLKVGRCLGRQPSAPARQGDGCEDLEGLLVGPWSGLGRRGRRRDVLPAVDLRGDVEAFGLDPLFGPALPAASDRMEDPPTAPGEPQAIADPALSLPALNVAGARPISKPTVGARRWLATDTHAEPVDDLQRQAHFEATVLQR